jgi:hypothetical protein
MKTISTILFATFLIIGTANASPIQWTAGDGHWYDVVFLDPVLEWETARDLAHESGGYLASLTSAEENEFVWRFLNSNLEGDSRYDQYWLGGYQTDDLAEPDGHWAWDSGEEWSDTNWRVGEPNNYVDGTQDYLHYWGTATGEWDDMENGRYMAGYVLEYDERPVVDDERLAPVPTPEPSTMFLLGSGLLALGGFRRRMTRS